LPRDCPRVAISTARGTKNIHEAKTPVMKTRARDEEACQVRDAIMMMIMAPQK
jgi:hypothetical protein